MPRWCGIPHPPQPTVRIPGSRRRNAWRIEFGAQISVKTAVGPNPFVPGADLRTVLSSQVVNFYGNVLADQSRGTLIALTTTVPLQEESGAYGHANVYDAVGNLVQRDLPVRRAATDRDYGVVWNGINRNNRSVGSGGYLAIIRGTDILGKSIEQRVKIGVGSR